MKSQNKYKLYLLIIVLFISCSMVAQEDTTQSQKSSQQCSQVSVPVEVMVGNDYASYQVVINKQIGSPESRFSFYSMINYDMYYADSIPDNYFIQSIFFYNFWKNFGVGLGVNSKPYEGTKPLIALTYSLYTESIGLYIQPSYEIWKDGLFEVYNLFSWTPVNDKKIQPYFKLEVYTSWGNAGHSYSYHNWRLGLQYKIFRFGPALNVAYFGKDFESATNWGGFVNINIF